MAPSNARAPATAGGKARALAPTAPPPSGVRVQRAPPRRLRTPRPPPPLANLFKLCGVDGMKNITREGNVATVHDKFLGRKVLVVQGNVPAANFARLPKVGRPALGLTGGFLYAQVKLDPERVFAVHVDLICVISRPTSRARTPAWGTRSVARRFDCPSPTCTVARPPRNPSPSGRASPLRMNNCYFRLGHRADSTFALLKKGQKKGDVAKTLTFESVRSTTRRRDIGA